MSDEEKNKIETIKAFVEKNAEEGLRVFVAGGARSGNDEIYVEEAYELGRQIIKMDLRLDFGLSNSGIMGAVAQGVIDGWNKKAEKDSKSPIQGITTTDYFKLYPQDDNLLNQIGEVVLAQTLEERKQKLLNADFVVFAPGGVGTLDELAYDCVAMQDGFLDMKPFILYNVEGFFYHLLEYLKQIAAKGFANPLPFIVVDNSRELEIAFRLLKLRYVQSQDSKTAYGNTRQLIYELPYFLKRKVDSSVHVEDIIAEMDDIRNNGTDEQKAELDNEIEQAYLEKEIERMYERLAKTGCDTSVVSEKLTKLKKRRKKWK
ncbi:MAG: LOG family protein [Alphaproteobacteria bacterium]|nr:LOG family protein [Alphaproteobacteria bacterium]